MEMIPVTIGIPAYNSGRYIGQCLESILIQTYSNLEIIVVDNGSTDNTQEIVFSFKDPRVRFHRNPENIYCYGSTNVIISLAKTHLVAVYHSDDAYKPTIVEEQVKFLENHKDVMAVFTEAELINSKGEIIGEWEIPKELKNIDILDFQIAYNKFIKYGDFLICPSGMFVKKVFLDVGFFKGENFFSKTQDKIWIELLEKYGMNREMIMTANDLEMWLRILQKYPVGILHKKLMYYRIHPAQGSLSHSTSYENFFIVMDYYERYARENNLISEDCMRHYRAKKIRWIFSRGQKALNQNQYIQARKEYWQFIKSFHFLYSCLELKDISRFFWALAVVLSGPFTVIFKKFLKLYFAYKQSQQQKKMRLP